MAFYRLGYRMHKIQKEEMATSRLIHMKETTYKKNQRKLSERERRKHKL